MRYARPLPADRRRDPAAEAREERVAGAMTERVVVALEAVEVEEDQRLRIPGYGGGQRVVNVVHELAAVAQTAERVGDRLLTAAAQQRDVLTQRQPSATSAEEERRPRERDCEIWDVAQRGVQHDAQRHKDGQGGRRDDLHPPAALGLATRRLPRGH
jgi:hypothetical protein